MEAQPQRLAWVESVKLTASSFATLYLETRKAARIQVR